MVSNYRGIVDCITNDFVDFCDTKYIELTNNGVIHKKYNFGFNHESPDHANLYLHEN